MFIAITYIFLKIIGLAFLIASYYYGKMFYEDFYLKEGFFIKVGNAGVVVVMALIAILLLILV